MTAALLEPAFRRIDATTFYATPTAAGPWSCDMCHGGAVAVLAARIASEVPTLSPMEIARFGIELFRPVPVAELRTQVKIEREGKKLQLLTISVCAGDMEVARGTILKLRTKTLDLPDGIVVQGSKLAEPLSLPVDIPRFTGGFAKLFDMRCAEGSFREYGPSSIWFSPKGQFFDDAVTDPVLVAVAAADFSNGASTMLSFKDWLFLNADLTINLYRQPNGGWVAIAAKTHVGPDGRAMSHCELADELGWFGQATQTLLLDRR
jgi:hypothetical protein